jgi:hypothetical protein
MARPRRTTNTSFRIPNEDYQALAEYAAACEWAVNSEVVAAVQFWLRQTREVRAEQRGRTKEAAETDAGRGYQHQSGKYAFGKSKVKSQNAKVPA